MSYKYIKIDKDDWKPKPVTKDEWKTWRAIGIVLFLTFLTGYITYHLLSFTNLAKWDRFEIAMLTVAGFYALLHILKEYDIVVVPSIKRTGSINRRSLRIVTNLQWFLYLVLLTLHRHEKWRISILVVVAIQIIISAMEIVEYFRVKKIEEMEIKSEIIELEKEIEESEKLSHYLWNSLIYSSFCIIFLYFHFNYTR